MEDIVLYEKSGDIGKITLNKPEERNTITLDVLKKLIDLFEMSAENNDVCVIYAAKDKQCLSVHSLSFIKYISSMAKVIQAKDPIKFNIRNDNPLRAEIEFKSLDDTKMVFFIAPRIEEVEIEEDDKEDFEEY